jgi:pimeloyl-ACP methyl ester carboxylesterase
MPELQFVDANGLRFAYFEEGSGPLVLLVHGFPDTPHTWDEVRPALARAGYRAVSPYTRGYAPTAIPADGKYDGDALGADVLALIPALGADKAILVGHDWGAGACYSAATVGPERIERLITVAVPHPASLRPSLRLLWGARHFIRFQWKSADRLLRADDFAHVDELVHRWSPAWQVPPGEAAAVKECFRQPGSVEAALGYYRAVGLKPPSSQRGKIGVPTVAFAGTDDPTLRVADYERARRRFTGPYDVVAMPGGHFLHREHGARFIDELLRVLPAVTRSAPRTAP